MSQRNKAISDEAKFESYELAMMKYLEEAREFHQNTAARKIQASARAMLGRSDYLDMRYAAECIQTNIRGYVIRKCFIRMRDATIRL